MLICRTTHTVQITTGETTVTLNIPQAHKLLAQLANALLETYTEHDQSPVNEPMPPVSGHIEPLIGAAEAQTIAQDVYGLHIPKSTLISAYPTIDGAQKVGGRWKMPPANFRDWLHTWASKQ